MRRPDQTTKMVINEPEPELQAHFHSNTPSTRDLSNQTMRSASLKKTTQALITFQKEIGAGSEGVVFNAIWDVENKKTRCVIKYVGKNTGRIKTGQTFSLSDYQIALEEMSLHKKMTEAISSSAESGVLNLLCEFVIDESSLQAGGDFDFSTEDLIQYAEFDAMLPPGKYSVMPRCDAILEDSIVKIVALKTSKPALYQHLLYHFVDSMRRTLTTLNGKEGFEVTHGDIKPGNLGLRYCLLGKPQRKFYRWTVYDFGMAKLNTAPCELKGTPLYMAPELFLSSGADDDARHDLVDVWSYGQILGELLDKKPVFWVEDTNDTYQVGFRIVQHSLGILWNEVPPVCSRAESQLKIENACNFEECYEALRIAACQFDFKNRADLSLICAACEKMEKLLSSLSPLTEGELWDLERFYATFNSTFSETECNFFTPKDESDANNPHRVVLDSRPITPRSPLEP